MEEIFADPSSEEEEEVDGFDMEAVLVIQGEERTTRCGLNKVVPCVHSCRNKEEGRTKTHGPCLAFLRAAAPLAAGATLLGASGYCRTHDEAGKCGVPATCVASCVLLSASLFLEYEFLVECG